MLKVKNLSFSYDGKKPIFSNFDLDIPRGQVCLITGINGVGKSTLLRLFAGVLLPDSGRIIFNKKMGSNPKRKIGFISDKLSLYESLTVAEGIRFHKSAYDLDQFDDHLLRHTNIDFNKKIKELSSGQRTIYHLSLILSHQPEMLLIDEVIHSIDSYLRKLFIDQLIELLSEKKVTLIMVNLNFYDIENLVERVLLLRSGRIVIDEKIESLKDRIKKVTAKELPEGIPCITQIKYEVHSDFYIYPFKEDYSFRIKNKAEDLNLTEIVTAFIRGEYSDNENIH